MKYANTAEAARAVNNCGRYLSVSVLRAVGRDCTNNGVTVRYDRFFIPHPEGPILAFELTLEDRERVLNVLPPAMEGCPVRVKPAQVYCHSMAGGNFVYSCDSRFAQFYGAPLSVHDRVE